MKSLLGLVLGEVSTCTDAGKTVVRLSGTIGRGKLWGFLICYASVSEMLKLLNQARGTVPPEEEIAGGEKRNKKCIKAAKAERVLSGFWPFSTDYQKQ